MNRTELTWLVPALLLFGLVIRVIFHLQYAGSIFWGDLSVDEQLHQAWAQYIASGHLIGDAVFFRAPLYPYFLALLFKLTGSNLHAVLIIQHLVGIATGYLLFVMTKKMFSYTTGAVALVLYIMCPVFVYFEGQLLLDFLILPLVLAALIFLYLALTDDMRLYWVLSGIFFGLTSLTRPNILLFMLFLVIWLFVHLARSRNNRTALARVATLLIFCGLIIAPVTVRNYLVSGDLVPISSQGGINMYLGNNEDADGVSAYMPGLGFDWEYMDCIHIAENDEGRSLSASEVSDYWYGKVVKYVLEKPESFLPLFIKKVCLLLNNHEISNNRNITFVFDKVWIAWFLPVGLWLLLPLALVGTYARRKNTWTGLIALYLVTYSLSVVMFFINSRFRLPIMLLLTVPAALGVEAIAESILQRRIVRAAVMIVVLISVAYWTTTNPYNIDFRDHAQEEYSLGNHAMEEGKFDDALARYHAAIADRPTMNQVNLNIGSILLRKGDLDSARVYFLRELRVAVDSSKAYNNLGVVERFAHNDSLSLEYLRRALDQKPYYTDAVVNYAITARQMGLRAEAIDMLDNAIAADSSSSQLYRMRGVLRFDLGMLAAARGDFQHALELLQRSIQPSFATMSAAAIAQARPDTGDKATILYHLGTIAGRTGSLDSAVTLLTEAASLDSSLIEARINLSTALVQQGRFAEAEKTCASLIDSGHGNALVWYLMAVSKLNLGDMPGASAAVDSALAIEPDFKPAISMKGLIEKTKAGGD